MGDDDLKDLLSALECAPCAPSIPYSILPQELRPPQLVHSPQLDCGDFNIIQAKPLDACAVALADRSESRELITKAYYYAQEKHKDQRRESGEPYFNHLVATAKLATQLQLDPDAIAAALLHDTIEDCGVTHEDLSQEFSPVIADLVEGVSKLTEFEHSSRSYRQAENLKKMLVAAGRDVRVILVKLCDRIHNMRTLEFMTASQQKRKATETSDFYAPIAHRLGLLSFRLELEELCFKYLEPKSFDLVKTAMDRTAGHRQEYIEQNERIIRDVLRESHINGVVASIERTPHYIWRKMQEREVIFDEVSDIVNILVIVQNESDCYNTLGAIHSHLRPIPFQFIDYIARPRSNMYQSLHTTVMSITGERLSIKIRTHEMHKVVRRGIIEYWYAQSAENQNEFNLRWMHNFLEEQKQIKNPEEFLDSIRSELFPFEIVVLTPRGETLVLPHMATPLDFAYALSDRMGHRTQGALVNGREVALGYRLRNGDTVELIIGDQQKPSVKWLDHVRLAKTRQSIQRYLDHEEQRCKYTLGREITANVLREAGLDIEEVESSTRLGAIAIEKGFESIAALYCAVVDGLLLPADLIIALCPGVTGLKLCSSKSDDLQNAASADTKVFSDDSQSPYQLSDNLKLYSIESAPCCNPILGESIVGVVSKSGRIHVHSFNCKVISDFSQDKIKKVDWNPKFKGAKTVQIVINTHDKLGMLKAVIETISKLDISINQADISTSKKGEGRFELQLILAEYKQFQLMISLLEKLDGVIAVKRV
jgi:GTP diphosphokinase / guanosine-3',5'-bis(diphosphate) 3'-diphosphatase